jgi:hypothetical protein
MSSPYRLLAVGLTACIALFVVTPIARAQEHHVVDRSAMKSAVTAKAHADDAVATLSPAEVHALVGPARAASSASGGDTIIITTTTLLLLLLLIVLVR